MSETAANRIRRLRMRSARRGIREMDLILTAFADARLDRLDDRSLQLYDALLQENDQDLYQWVTGQRASPDRFRAMIAEISRALQPDANTP